MKHPQAFIKFSAYNKNWSKKVKNKLTNEEHLYILGIGFLISTIIYILILKIVKFTFIPAPSDAINWLTINKYPKQEDYYIFLTFIGFTYLFSIIVWYIWVSLKIKK